jgi:hypothetical protein
MTELVERYIHQVGRYLPPKERAEIEAELRSQLQDQLDDRFMGEPSKEEVAAFLAEFGHPYKIAAAYSGERYLVGPMLYPFMIMVLRYGWLIIPAIVIFVNIFGALTAEQTNPVNLIVETVLALLQTTLIFTAIVVLFFALIERSYIRIDAKEDDFNPLDLPEVNDPGNVDRAESAFGIAFGMVVTLILLYFLRVGGLTLRFNLSDPGEVIPVPVLWLVLLIVLCIAMVILHLFILRRSRWNVALWITETLLELTGMICLYFVIYEPLVQRFVPTTPALADLPEILVIFTAVITLIGKGSKLIALWNYPGRA